jgi:hypothetical protein
MSMGTLIMLDGGYVPLKSDHDIIPVRADRYGHGNLFSIFPATLGQESVWRRTSDNWSTVIAI